MIDYTYKDLYYEDSVDKQLKIEVEDGTVITNEDIFSESMTLTESLCSETSLTFGSCEASKLEIKIANQFYSMKDQWLTISEVLNGHEDDPFVIGKYRVDSDRPTADRTFRQIVAYDAMYDIINADQEDVANWYNDLLPEDDSTVTMKEFRDSFLNHFGLEAVEKSLPNDDMIVEKTLSATSLSGKTVITAICELNGCFGHINRNNKFDFVTLSVLGNDEDTAELGKMILGKAVLGSVPTNELDPSQYITSDYEDYVCEKIDRLKIAAEDGDIGAEVGTDEGDNYYIVSGNFLVYGKGTKDLTQIANNLYSAISAVSYRPAEVDSRGNPCVEVGDGIVLYTKYQEIQTYVLQRTLKGIQALRDTYTSQGTEKYPDSSTSLETSVEQLKGKTNSLTRTVEETRSEIKDVEEGLSTEIVQTAEGLTLLIQNTSEELNTKIDLTAEGLTLQIQGVEDKVILLNEEAITNTQVEYYKSSSPTELLDGEWTTETPEWEEGYYIWERTVITAGVGDESHDFTTEPVCLTGNTGAQGEPGEDGTPGPAGADGKTSYFHVKYSPVADPTAEDMTETPSEYIGTYVDFTEADSTDPSDYEWVKWLGEDGAQGIPGTNGQDGKTYYLHIAYANSEDGTVDFSVSDSEDKSYIGQYVDTEPEDSTNPSDYAWTKIKGDDGVGVESITAYYAISYSPNYYPTYGGDTTSVLGTMILGTGVLGNSGVWTPDFPDVADDEYLWISFHIVYTDGTTENTVPACLTDASVRTQLNGVTEKMADIEVSLDEIRSYVQGVTTYFYDEYEEVVTQVSEITQTMDNISLRVTETDEKLEETNQKVSEISLSMDSITLEVSSTGTEGSASIRLEINNKQVGDSVDVVTDAREAFAEETTSITIEAGTITFASDTLVVDSDGFKLTAEGDVTVKGEITATSLLAYDKISMYNTYYDETVDILYYGNGYNVIEFGQSGESYSIDAYNINLLDSAYCACSFHIGTSNNYGVYYTQEGSSGSAQILVYQKWSGNMISLQCGSGGSNRGVYDNTGSGKWIIYYDGSNVYIPSSTSITGTLSTSSNISIGTTSDTSTRRIEISNSYGILRVSVTTSGNKGLYDESNSKWIIYSSKSGSITTNSLIQTESVLTVDEISNLSAPNFRDPGHELLTNISSHTYEVDGKEHIGLTVAEVEESMKEAGMNPDDYDLTDHWTNEDGEEVGSICYDEFIPMLITEIQNLNTKVEELESKLA